MIFDEAQFIKNHTGKTHPVRAAARFGIQTRHHRHPDGEQSDGIVVAAECYRARTVPVAGGVHRLLPQTHRIAFDARATGVLRRGSSRSCCGAQRIRSPLICRPAGTGAGVDLSSRHRKIYDTRLARERQKVLRLLGDWEKNRFPVFRSLSLLRQLSLHARSSTIAPRVPHRRSTISPNSCPNWSPKANALVFSQFTRFLHILTAHLDKVGIAYSYLDGSMNAAERADAVRRFTSGRPRCS